MTERPCYDWALWPRSFDLAELNYESSAPNSLRVFGCRPRSMTERLLQRLGPLAMVL